MATTVKRYVTDKRAHCVEKGLGFYLTGADISILLMQAGISITQVGLGKGKYSLARRNEITGEVDTGAYELGNCRFILSEDNLREMVNPMLGREHSDETKAKIAAKAKGRIVSTETRAKMAATARAIGKIPPESAGMKKGYNYTLTTCPHCGKEGGGGNMKRYHFDNCKNLTRN